MVECGVTTSSNNLVKCSLTFLNFYNSICYRLQMAAVATGKSWRDFFEKNLALPAAFDREHAAHDISTPICIGLTNVEGINPTVRVACRALFLFTCPSLFVLNF